MFKNRKNKNRKNKEIFYLLNFMIGAELNL